MIEILTSFTSKINIIEILFKLFKVIEFEVIAEAFEVQLAAYKNNLSANPEELARRQRTMDAEVKNKEDEIAKLNKLSIDTIEKKI